MSIEAAVASHRFGLSETSLSKQRTDPRAWVVRQMQQPAPMGLEGAPNAASMAQLTRTVLRQGLAESNDRQMLRRLNLEGLQRRWTHQIETPTPVHERWVMFWANHFTVAATKGTTLGLVWPFENEAIRPHATGRFQDLLRAATTHPGMLLYLDNAQSIGPGSRVGRRRERGLNENLARELLELHTLGVRGGYTQADVGGLARILTGWTVGRPEQPEPGFVSAIHEPGSKQVLGKTYPEGPEALDMVLADLARHPATAQHLATKLARHFVCDDPPDDLIRAVAKGFANSGGDLLQTARALFEHDLAWAPYPPGKVRRPEELLISAHRLLKLPMVQTERSVAAITAMGQPITRAPSPQGWPDREDDWLGPDALLKRVEWAAAVGQAAGNLADARALAELAWGPALSATTRQQVQRAESGAQALALLLASPEFQRR